jgi:uncharacterized membrane protein YqaE (UPF0057 family)
MDTVLLCILNMFFPFLAVAIRKGIGEDLCINIALCILGWVPGIIHGFYVLLKSEDK